MIKVIKLPLSRGLYKSLTSVREGDFGVEVSNIILIGFARNVLCSDFNLNAHIFRIEQIKGMFGYEAFDLKRTASELIMRMTISYRRFFKRFEYRDIRLIDISYNRRSMTISFEV